MWTDTDTEYSVQSIFGSHYWTTGCNSIVDTLNTHFFCVRYEKRKKKRLNMKKKIAKQFNRQVPNGFTRCHHLMQYEIFSLRRFTILNMISSFFSTFHPLFNIRSFKLNNVSIFSVNHREKKTAWTWTMPPSQLCYS